MSINYRFRIQPVRLGSQRRYQLRVGLDGERDFEYVPVHRTAFAERFEFAIAHPTEAGAKFELSGLLEWLQCRAATRKTKPAGADTTVVAESNRS